MSLKKKKIFTSQEREKNCNLHLPHFDVVHNSSGSKAKDYNSHFTSYSNVQVSVYVVTSVFFVWITLEDSLLCSSNKRRKSVLIRHEVSYFSFALSVCKTEENKQQELVKMLFKTKIKEEFRVLLIINISRFRAPIGSVREAELVEQNVERLKV